MLLSILPTILTINKYSELKKKELILLKSMINTTRIYNDYYGCIFSKYTQTFNKDNNALTIENYYINHHIDDNYEIFLIKFLPNDFELKLTDKKNPLTFTRRKRIKKNVKSIHLNKNIKSKFNTEIRFLNIIADFYQAEWKKFFRNNKEPAKTEDELKQEEKDAKEKMKKEKKDFKAAKKGKTKAEKKKLQNEIRQKKKDEDAAFLEEKREKTNKLYKNFLDSYFVVKQLINYIKQNDEHNVLSIINPYQALSTLLSLQSKSNNDIEASLFNFKKLKEMLSTSESMKLYLDRFFIKNEENIDENSEPCIFAIYCVNTFYNTHAIISNYYYYSDGKIYSNGFMSEAIRIGYNKTLKKVVTARDFMMKEKIDLFNKEEENIEEEVTEQKENEKEDEKIIQEAKLINVEEVAEDILEIKEGLSALINSMSNSSIPTSQEENEDHNEGKNDEKDLFYDEQESDL